MRDQVLITTFRPTFFPRLSSRQGIRLRERNLHQFVVVAHRLAVLERRILRLHEAYETDVRLYEAWLHDVARLGFEPAADANSNF